jgi:hypothetical protein
VRQRPSPSVRAHTDGASNSNHLKMPSLQFPDQCRVCRIPCRGFGVVVTSILIDLERWDVKVVRWWSAPEAVEHPGRGQALHPHRPGEQRCHGRRRGLVRLWRLHLREEVLIHHRWVGWATSISYHVICIVVGQVPCRFLRLRVYVLGCQANKDGWTWHWAQDIGWRLSLTSSHGVLGGGWWLKIHLAQAKSKDKEEPANGSGSGGGPASPFLHAESSSETRGMAFVASECHVSHAARQDGERHLNPKGQRTCALLFIFLVHPVPLGHIRYWALAPDQHQIYSTVQYSTVQYSAMEDMPSPFRASHHLQYHTYTCPLVSRGLAALV